MRLARSQSGQPERTCPRDKRWGRRYHTSAHIEAHQLIGWLTVRVGWTGYGGCEATASWPLLAIMRFADSFGPPSLAIGAGRAIKINTRLRGRQLKHRVDGGRRRRRRVLALLAPSTNCGRRERVAVSHWPLSKTHTHAASRDGRCFRQQCATEARFRRAGH